MLQTVVGVVLAATAVVVYLEWIPLHVPDPARVRALVVTQPVGGVVGAARVTDPPAWASALAAVRTAAGTTPGETGLALATWKGNGSVSSGSLLATALPTVLDAQEALSQSGSQYLGQDSYKQSGYGYGGTLAFPGASGARGAYFLAGTSPTVTAKTRRIAVAVFRRGRVVVLVTVSSTGAAADSTASSLVTAEHRLLTSAVTARPIAETSVPLLATLVYAVVAAVLLGGVVLAPAGWASYARRRRAAQEAARRRARNARGKKVVTRRSSHGYEARLGSKRARSRR